MSAPTPESRATVRLEESYTETSEVLMPDSTNDLGRALGGWVLDRMDICGAIAARRFSRGQVVTASIEGVDFHTPIDLGEIVVVRGYVYDIGRTSMQVHVDVTAERPSADEVRETAASHLTFVAIDESGDPRPVPMLACRSKREHDLMARGLDD